jgi:hypothetical protein
MANQEEMRWNPILSLWNLLKLGRVFTYLVQLEIPLFSWLLNWIGMMIWFSMTWIQIPIPAKITLYVGDPVPYDLSRDSIDDVRQSPFLFVDQTRIAFLSHEDR